MAVARRVAVVAGERVEAFTDTSCLEKAGFTIERRYKVQNTRDESALIEALSDCWAVVAGGERYSRAVIAALPGLRMIARVGVGYDAVDIAAATELGRLVTITPGTIEPAVGEWTVAHIIAVQRRLLLADRVVRSGAWGLPDPLFPSLLGATVGLVGLGRIGREVVKRLAGFGCTLIACDPLANAAEWRERNVEIVDLPTLLKRSDVVTLHLPLSPATHWIIGREQLALMRPSAIIVNTSRGGLIDETALVEALRAGRLAGAGLDTFEQEPLPMNSPLIGLDSVVLSGHVAYATHAAARSSAQNAVNAVCAAAAGKVPAGLLNPEVLTKSPLVDLLAAG